MTAARGISAIGLMRSQTIQLTRQVGPLLTLLSGGVLLVLFALLVAATLQAAAPPEDPSAADAVVRQIPVAGFAFSQLFIGAAATVLVTTEWASGAVITTIATTQRRFGLVWSKAVVAAIASGFVVAISALIGVLCANPLLAGTGHTIDLGEWAVQRELLGTIAAGAAAAMIAVGLALLLRRTALALVVFIGLDLIAPIVFALVPGDVVKDVSRFLPMNVFSAMMRTGEAMDGAMSIPAAYLVAAIFAVVALAAGWWRTSRDG